MFFINKVTNVLTEVVPFCKSDHTHTYIYIYIGTLEIADKVIYSFYCIVVLAFRTCHARAAVS